MFLKFFCVYILFFISFGYAIHPTSRIKDDTEVDIKAHPYQVNIEYKIVFRCSGVLISDSWILTNAQCVATVNMDELRIRAGTAMRDILGELRNVSEIIVHPNFDMESLDYDLALLNVSEPYEFSDSIGNVVIGSRVPYRGYMLTTTGWGAQLPGNWLVMNLLEAQVPFIYQNDCVYNYQRIANNVTSNMICAGEKGNGACQGDTGNPLLYNDQVIGIMSWSYGCGQANYPAVYTAVYKFKEWAERIVFPDRFTTTTTESTSTAESTSTTPDYTASDSIPPADTTEATTTASDSIPPADVTQGTILI